MPGPHRWRDPLLCAALALVARIAHAAFVATTPFFDGLVIDALAYRRLAEAIAGGHGVEGAFYQPPLYPAIVAALIAIGAGSSWAIAIAHASAGAATVALLVVVARAMVATSDDVYVRRVALGTGVVAALYGPLVLFDVEMLPPAFVHLPLVAAWALALRAPPRPAVRDGIAGVLLGMATVGWALSIVFAPFVAWLRYRRVARRYRPIAAVVMIAAGCALPVAVVWGFNAREGSPSVIVSWNGGLNLWLGNNPRWRDTWRARPGAEFEPELERPDRMGITTPGARSRWFAEQALADVARRPGAAAARTVEKLYYAWHGREIRRNQDIDLLRDASPLLAALTFEAGVLFFPFGIVAPLALLAAWRRRREPVPRALVLAAIAYSIVLSFFFVAARYRLPMAIALLPLAVDRVVAAVRERRVPRAELAAFVVLLVALNLPNAFTASFRADGVERGLLRAQALRANGDLAGASGIADLLVARRPDRANVHMLRAELYEAQGRCDAAIPHLRRTAELAPAASTPWVRLGHCARRAGDPEGAERAYARALAIHPHHAQALQGAAILYMESGRRDDAIALLRRFRRNGYADDGVDFDLGRLLLESGRIAEACAVLVPLRARRANDPELDALVERCRAMARDQGS